MSEIWHTVFGWTAHVTLAGGGVLLLGWLAVRFVREPVIRQQIAAWTVRGAVVAAGLCLLPGWWSVPGLDVQSTPLVAAEPVPTPGEAVSPDGATVSEEASRSTRESVEDEWDYELLAVLNALEQPTYHPAELPLTNALVPPPSPATPISHAVAEPVSAWELTEFLPLTVVPYAVVACVLLMQLFLGYLALAWLRRTAHPAPTPAQRELTRLTEAGDRRVELRVHARLSSPVCFGLFRWVILIPPSLAASTSTAELRWILAHELDHLRRGDPWTSVWAGVCRAVFFCVPWFWLLRRELYLSQEYLADAAAAAADGRVVDYAAFLVDLSGDPQSRTPSSLLGASAARASHSDLFRRVTMVLNSGGQLNRRCPRRWTTAVISAVMLTAVCVSGFTWSTAEADDERPARRTEERRTEDRRTEDRPAPPRGEERGPRPPRGEFRPHFRPVDPAQLRKTLDQLEKAAQKGDQEAVRELMAELRRMMPPPPPPFGERPRDGEGPRGPGPRDGEGPRGPGPRDGEGPRGPGPRDGEGPRGSGPRDGEGPRRPGPRDGEGPRGPGPRDGEGPRGPGPRDGEGPRGPGPRDGEGPSAERPAFPPFARNPEFGRNMEKSLQDALERLKDMPEAREQVQKAIDQLHRSLEGTHRPQFGFGFPMGGVPPMFPGRGGPRLGMMLMPVSELVAEQLSLPKNSGMVVAAVQPDSAADKAGLQKNDIVIRFAGKDVTANPREIHELMGQVHPGDTVEVVVIRKGKKETLKTTLPESRPNRESDKDREREKNRDRNREREKKQDRD